MNPYWTKPYCGVQHLKGHPYLDGENGVYRCVQVTVTKFDTVDGGTILKLVRDPATGNFKRTEEPVYHKDIVDAIEDGENWFRGFASKWQ